MRGASFAKRYRLTLPEGDEWTCTDGQGRSYSVDGTMEWVRPESARVIANMIARQYPELAFTVEEGAAVGRGLRADWRPVWYSPAAARARGSLLERVRRAWRAWRTRP
jgi:hypothetical protein